MKPVGLLVVVTACAAPAPPPAPPPPAPPASAEAAPVEHASDWLRRGMALVKLGESGNHDAFEQAKEALGHCLDQDPRLAECHFLLGEACEFTDEEACAVGSYTQAVVLEPASPDYYAPLAETYLRFKLNTEAEQVLHEAVRRVPRVLKNAAKILELYRMLALIRQERGDREGMVQALEAGAREGGSDPALDYELGTAYLTLDPPRAPDAVRSLQRFVERACHDPIPEELAPKCALAKATVARLGDEAPVVEGTAKTPAPEKLAGPAEPLELPPAPELLPQHPIRDGDAFTVWGASYYLRSRAHRADVVREGPDRAIAITGYITKTNLSDAPKCAVHRPGHPDPAGCPRPIPTFWLGDSKDAAPGDCIRVQGWASNYAQIFEAIRAFDRHHPDEYIDGFWGVSIPNPLPAVGAKVTVRGTYGTHIGRTISGEEEDPQMGILTYESETVLEPAGELASLPGIARKGAREKGKR